MIGRISRQQLHCKEEEPAHVPAHEVQLTLRPYQMQLALKHGLFHAWREGESWPSIWSEAVVIVVADRALPSNEIV